MLKKHKAFLGAAIGAVTSIAGGLISRNAEKKAARRQAIAQNRLATFEEANALTQSYADTSAADDMIDRIEMARLGCSKRRRGVPNNTNRVLDDVSRQYNDRLDMMSLGSIRLDS